MKKILIFALELVLANHIRKKEEILDTKAMLLCLLF